MDVLGAYLMDELMGGFYEEPIGIRGEKKGLGLNSSVFCMNLCAVYEPLRCLVFGLCFGVRELFFYPTNRCVGEFEKCHA